MKLIYQQVLEEMNRNHIHWDRVDEKHIVVWSLGYKTADCYTIEDFLTKAGMFCLKHDFDHVCGKTRSIYRHK